MPPASGVELRRVRRGVPLPGVAPAWPPPARGAAARLVTRLAGALVAAREVVGAGDGVPFGDVVGAGDDVRFGGVVGFGGGDGDGDAAARSGVSSAAAVGPEADSTLASLAARFCAASRCVVSSRWATCRSRRADLASC